MLLMSSSSETTQQSPVLALDRRSPPLLVVLLPSKLGNSLNHVKSSSSRTLHQPRRLPTLLL